ncbi:MAG: M23 family metallopeptidase, partial [Defluviitaleaceae bacterium]|nr:M23 family metallopeptidase [Defluviitaleaceae bacterium]
VAVGFEPLTIAAGAFSGYLDSRSNHQGAQAFRFLVTESGYYTFTASSAGAPFTPFAPMLFDAVAQPGVIPVEMEFPPIHIIPERYEPDGSLRNYFRVRTYLNRGTMVVVAVSGEADSNFRIAVAGEAVWPVPTHHNIAGSVFGRRFSPTNNVYQLHAGIDISTGIGVRVNAVMSGTIAVSQYSRTAGEFIEVLHENNFTTRYLHLDSRLVSVGHGVHVGHHIGNSGATGAVASRGHLHFELINPSGNAINTLARYHASSFRTTNHNPFFSENPIVVFNPSFCWDCARGYVYNTPISQYVSSYVCARCRH